MIRFLHYPIIRCCAVTREIQEIDLAIAWIMAHVWFFRIVGGLIVLGLLILVVVDVLKIAGKIINPDDSDIKY